MGTGDKATAPNETLPLRVCVVGSGTRFLSGISYYTMRLANALADQHQTSAILMRQLLPGRLYPGRNRIGAPLTSQTYDPRVRVFDGVDWYWLPSILLAMVFLIRQRPNIVIFQWWTGTVLHSYLALALMARLLGARLIVEFHEVQDTGEMRIPFARFYVNLLAPWLMRLASGFVIHSEYDRPVLEQRYTLGQRPVEVIPLGSFDQYLPSHRTQSYRDAPDSVCNLLFFGVIRPYKGLEDLITAFNTLSPEVITNYWLTIVGETWEGWTLPAEMIASSPYRDRITFVNRYVSDDEVSGFFAGVDAVVLPYHRSSASGPVHTSMSWGLPLITTRVGGLTEAVSQYEGAILVPPGDPTALCEALTRVITKRGMRYKDPHTWSNTCELFNRLFVQIANGAHVAAYGD